MNISQRQATLVVLGFQLTAILILWLNQLIAKPRNDMFALGAGLASVVYGGMLFAYLRGWEYAKHTSVVLITLIVAAFLPEPFVTTYAPFLILLGPILALVLLNPRWVIGSAVATIGILLFRAGGIGVYASITTLLNYVMLIAGLVVSRMISDSIRLRAERAEAALREMHDDLELQFQQRTTALAQANTLLETMLEYVPDQIYFKDAESRFIKNSKSQAIALGLSDPSQVIGKTDFDFFPHAQRSYDEEQEIIRSGKPLVDFEEHVVWPDKSETWISTTKMPLRDQAGQIIGTFGISRDITERKRNEAALQKAKDELEVKVAERTNELKETNAQLQLELNERKQAQEKLRESEERYRRFFENMHETFIIQEVVVDEFGKPIDLRYLDLNPAAEHILGKARTEIIGKTRSQISGRTDPEGVEMASRVASTGEPFHMIRHSPGFRGWFESFTYSLGSGIVATLSLDITERKQAEEALKNSEIRYRRLFESAKDGILILDADTGMIVDVNPFLTKLLGYSHNVFLGKTIWELGFFKDIAANRDNFLELQQKEYIRYEDLPLETAYGQRINVEFVSNVYQVDHHKVVQCNIRDITKRKRVEERQEFLMSASKALASSLDYETTLKTVAQLAVPKIADWCTVYLTAPDGSIKQVALTHVDPDKVKWARELQKRFPPNPNAPQGVAQVIRSGQAEFTPEIPAELLEPLKKDPEMSKLLDELQLTGGMTVPLTLQERTLGAISFVSAESRLRYATEDLELAEELARRAALAISNALLFQQVQDELAERKQAETALAHYTEDLRRSNAELEQFAYVASHDLQEPLRAVAGMVQLLQQRYKGKLDERADEYIGHAVEASGRMQSLINDLLEYSRVDRIGKPFSATNMERTLDLALANLQVAIHESGAQITRDPLPTVMADGSQLTQVFQNLIGNAIKFRGERVPQLHVSAEQVENGWRFMVRDNGIGIEPQYFERIFLVFQRLHTRREYSGTGIGLALCKKIVERHHGQIWVESQPEQGSIFYFTIPERYII